MPRNFAQLFTSLWDDRAWLALPMDGQWLYTMLLSQKALNYAGVLSLPRQMWATNAADEDAGDRVAAALKILEDTRFVVVDYATDELLVRSLIRRDIQKGPPGTFCVAMNEAIAVRSPKLRAVLYAELRRLDFVRIGDKKAGYRHTESPMEALQRALEALEPDAEPPGSGTSEEGPEEPSHSMPHSMPNGMPSHSMPHTMAHGTGARCLVLGAVNAPVESYSSSVAARARTHPPAHAPARAPDPALPLGQDPPPYRNGLAVVTDTGAAKLPPHVQAELDADTPAPVRRAANATVAAVSLFDDEAATWPMAPLGRERGRWVHAVAAVLAEGIPGPAVVVGLRACVGKGCGPKSLASFVFGEANRRGPESRADRNTKAILARITPDGGPTLEELEAAENAARDALTLQRTKAIEGG